ncbi:two-component sensor histidine kinase [Bacillus sp. HMF5848]|uniref:ATP-binding protein n=1 Tax=Bacillus sp. HMF5848 TaxID=2495421 RepID=UPI000F770C5B|nr:sensor histidine kinase [Bacillus sp. HMF5848]RSK26083.1 two-component sensor histidine kinase [Bacillus sp. HMF5848]
MTETLLINFLFFLFPVLTYLIFFENKVQPTKYKFYISFLTAIIMVLCMTFPIELEIGFIFDLRYVPFILAALFGGYKIALPLWFVLNLYRFYIGGDGVIPSLIFSTIVFLVVPLCTNAFLKLNSQKRILMASAISFIAMASYLTHISTYYNELNQHFWMIVLNVIGIHVSSTAIIMILIQKIIYNVKTREKFNDAERLNVISELAASITHEIRNPLTVTNGFLQLINESKNISEAERSYVDFSLTELRRAEKIVSDFLSLAKPQAENMIYSNLREEVEYVENIMMPYATLHQVELKLQFENTLNIKYDKNQIQQCLINLYKNGIEAMKNGGTLYVHVFEKKDNIIIKIQDHGIGMTQEEMTRIGKPYYSTKDEGTGLGMLTVFNTIHRLKGKIDLTSEKGKGTTFLISIPYNT